jgi:hypothetical protein
MITLDCLGTPLFSVQSRWGLPSTEKWGSAFPVYPSGELQAMEIIRDLWPQLILCLVLRQVARLAFDISKENMIARLYIQSLFTETPYHANK